MALVARIRSVHPSICDDEALANISAQAERTYVRLWTHLDDDGRAEDRPKLLAARLYPEHDDMGAKEVDRDLRELQTKGLLIRYEIEGKRFLSAKPSAWAKYQKPRHPSPSQYPAPPEDYVPSTADSGNATANGRKPHAGVGVGVGEGEDESPAKLIDLSFEDFWNAYPRHHDNGKPGGGASRAKAEATWKRLPDRDRSLCLAAVKNYAAWIKTPDAAFPAHATTWLNEKRWLDWQEPAKAPTSTNPYGERKPNPFDEDPCCPHGQSVRLVCRECEEQRVSA